MSQNDSPKSINALRDLIRTHLWLKLLIALALGVGAGFLLLKSGDRFPGEWQLTLADWLALPGTVYLTVIQMEISRQAGFSLTPQSIVKLIPVNPLSSLLNGDLQEVLIIALLFGLVISKMANSKTEIMLEFLRETKSLCMQIVTWTVKLAPYAIFGLMVRAIVNSGASVLLGMAGYLFSVLLGFVLLACVYMVWLTVIGNNPLRFLQKSKEPLLLAFSLSSSAATMPTTIQTAKEEHKISPEIAEFLIPLGTSVNMAGSALWMSSATLFLAQAFGNNVDLPTIVTIILMTVGASVGTPGVPGAGVGVLNSTLRSVGIPAAGIPLILGIDRLVDMGATVMNVMSDLVMCLTAEWSVRRSQKASATSSSTTSKPQDDVRQYQSGYHRIQHSHGKSSPHSTDLLFGDSRIED